MWWSADDDDNPFARGVMGLFLGVLAAMRAAPLVHAPLLIVATASYAWEALWYSRSCLQCPVVSHCAASIEPWLAGFY